MEIINELKLLLDETRDMTDEELRAEIARIAAEAGVELNGSQVGQLVTLCRALEKLDPDAPAGKGAVRAGDTARPGRGAGKGRRLLPAGDGRRQLR